MKKMLFLLLFFCIVNILFIQKTHAVNTTDVVATVGRFTIDISGYIAPKASVSLAIDGVLVRSTVANVQGYFSLPSVPVKEDFTSFCLTAVDFKQLGDSTTCITADSSSTKQYKDLFLPPTFGLTKTEVSAGGIALARGYSMPGATVTIHTDNGKTFTARADDNGYYEVNIEGLSAGTYKLSADAVYNGKSSLKPVKQKELKVLTLGEEGFNVLKYLWNKLLELLTSLGLGLLWLAIPIIILIIILLRKLYPQWFVHLKKLHHWWFVGY